MNTEIEVYLKDETSLTIEADAVRPYFANGGLVSGSGGLIAWEFLRGDSVVAMFAADSIIGYKKVQVETVTRRR